MSQETSKVTAAGLYGAHPTVQAAAAEGAWDDDREFVQRFASMLPPLSSVLDVAAGSGSQSGYFVEQDFQVSMTEGSEDMLTVAQKNVPRAAAGKVAVLPDIGFDGPFSGIFSRHVLQHLSLEHLEAALGNMQRALYPAGLLGLIVAVSPDEHTQHTTWEISPGESVPIHRYPMAVYEQLFAALSLRTVHREVGYEGRVPLMRTIVASCDPVSI